MYAHALARVQGEDELKPPETPDMKPPETPDMKPPETPDLQTCPGQLEYVNQQGHITWG